MKNNQELNDKQQFRVAISALTAKGDITQLKTHLNKGLDAGLSISEIKEELVQLYAYCGFPRSLNAVNAFMAVVEERKEKGITDEPGREASPVAAGDKYEAGKKNLQTLTGIEETGPKKGANGFAPLIDIFLKEHLFADIFSRDILTFQDRELITISTLATLSGVESQLQAHIGMGMNTGITEEQLKEAFQVIGTTASKKEGDSALEVLTKVVEARNEKNK
jgi:4-carboxymuconolactone decarboxylase